MKNNTFHNDRPKGGRGDEAGAGGANEIDIIARHCSNSKRTSSGNKDDQDAQMKSTTNFSRLGNMNKITSISVIVK